MTKACVGTSTGGGRILGQLLQRKCVKIPRLDKSMMYIYIYTCMHSLYYESQPIGLAARLELLE